ncbi:MAG: hypothetical protein CM1200mP20_13370 [Pseudomonadota bacterium]|nr:MAG: hypothetical protein CM1200mP20_13370 [Pseudomonadota bacterium]
MRGGKDAILRLIALCLETAELCQAGHAVEKSKIHIRTGFEEMTVRIEQHPLAGRFRSST